MICVTRWLGDTHVCSENASTRVTPVPGYRDRPSHAKPLRGLDLADQVLDQLLRLHPHLLQGYLLHGQHLAVVLPHPEQHPPAPPLADEARDADVDLAQVDVGPQAPPIASQAIGGCDPIIQGGGSTGSRYTARVVVSDLDCSPLNG